jgi:hypothetical protein
MAIRRLSALFAAGFIACAGTALADPITFAQVSENGTANGLTWTNNGSGAATLNTATAGGDAVTFSYQNISGLAPDLTGNLSAVMTINGGAGVTTTAPASQSLVGAQLFDAQAINAPLTISYNLAKAINGQSNLLTITITPNTPGADGLIIAGQNGGTGASSSTSQPTSPAASYTMSFTSSFLNFALNDPITAGYGYSSVDPMLDIAADGLLASFMAEFTGTFSSGLSPILVPEPASLALFGVGLVALGAMLRMRKHRTA